MHHKEACSLLLLRLGLGTVFILFGLDKLLHPGAWIVFYPPQVQHIIAILPYEFLKIQGIAETLIGLALVLGFLTRISAFLSGGILGLIIFFLWLDPLAIRDIGLFSIAIALTISGGGNWSLDSFFESQHLTHTTKPEKTS